MPSVSMSIAATIAGVGFSGTITRTGETPLETSVVVPAAKTATLTTRTDNDTGTFTALTGHGIITADVVDVYWVGGSRQGMTATVSGNSIVLDGGSGDNLPDQTTAVTLGKVQTVQQGFEGTLAKVLMVTASRRGTVMFPPVADPVKIAGGEAFPWASDLGLTNPVDDTVTSILVSNGDSAGTNTIKVGLLIDTVPEL